MANRSIGTDVIVLGAGPVGENIADRVTRGGLKTVLIEAELAGGECSYWACMPSKALIRPGTALQAARAVDGSRQAVTGTLDVAAVLARRDSFTAHWDDSGQVDWINSAGIEFLRGRARISGERTVTVIDGGGAITVTATAAVVLANGSSPMLPPLPGLDTVPFWGTKEATSAKEIPPRLAVIGGGVAGTELAQAFRRLGSEVTMLVRGNLLAKFPAQAAALVAEALRTEGVDLRLHTEASRIIARDSGGVDVAFDDDATLSVDQLLVSTGRRPNLSGIGLETIGLTASDGSGPGHVAGKPAPARPPATLEVDETGLVAGVDGQWLYAVGDAAGKVLLTHQGKYEARTAGDAIAARAAGSLSGTAGRWSQYAATADEVAVPQVVFTDPEVAMVGRTLEQVRAAGIRAESVELDLAVAGSALYADDYRGWAQMVVDVDRQVLHGVTFVGPEVAELLHAATIAVVGEVPLERLRHAVPAYPTISEVWLRLLEQYGL